MEAYAPESSCDRHGLSGQQRRAYREPSRTRRPIGAISSSSRQERMYPPRCRSRGRGRSARRPGLPAGSMPAIDPLKSLQPPAAAATWAEIGRRLTGAFRSRHGSCSRADGGSGSVRNGWTYKRWRTYRIGLSRRSADPKTSATIIDHPSRRSGSLLSSKFGIERRVSCRNCATAAERYGMDSLPVQFPVPFARARSRRDATCASSTLRQMRRESASASASCKRRFAMSRRELPASRSGRCSGAANAYVIRQSSCTPHQISQERDKNTTKWSRNRAQGTDLVNWGKPVQALATVSPFISIRL